ncbi:unnamed protein product, partial [Polarella glacialis]
WLKPITLPVNPNVDRSVCAEFQVFNELCDLVHQEGLADNMEECALVGGCVNILVSTTPCLSCVGAVMQYSLLFPNVDLAFGCVQPWHSEGGANRSALQSLGEGGFETAPEHREEPLVPAIWDGGRIVSGSDDLQPPALRTRPSSASRHLEEEAVAVNTITIEPDPLRSGALE